MLDFLEMEETVGRAWHRLVGGAASYPVNPDHAVSLAEMQSQIAVMFRAFGGEPGVRSQAPIPASRDIGWAGVSASGLATRASISRGATPRPCSCRSASRSFPIVT